MRVDVFLVKKGLVESRNKALELIKNSKIKIDGKIVKKASLKVNEDNKVEILVDKVYVSRAALKLKNYITKHNISFKDKKVLDVGASTGGFSEVVLESNPKKVVCVDVGVGQLHKSLLNRVENYENCDIRNFNYSEKFDVIVSDVSFISLNKIIDKLDSLADEFILLFKPQFEVGKNVKRDKNGVVKDKEAIDKAMKNFEENCKKLNWNLIRKEKSSILGKEGNEEFIYHFKSLKP